MIIPFLRQSPFNYSYLAGGATEDVVVGDRIPVFKAKTVNLSARIHRVNIASGASFQFLVYGSNPSGTDATNFVTSATIGSTSTITSASPNLVSLSAVISEPAHPFVRLVLRAMGPSATGNVYAELSADLVVKGNACGCDNGAGLRPPGQANILGAPEPDRAERDTCWCVGPAGGSEKTYKVPCPAGGGKFSCFGGWLGGYCGNNQHPEFQGGKWYCVNNKSP